MNFLNPFSWKKKEQIQQSQSTFYKGTNIFDKLEDSVFGKIKKIISQEDIDKYVLPKIIVIGAESTGKSSLLENITKCQLFPRDYKLCTKCPIHVKMTKGDPKYIVSYVITDPDTDLSGKVKKSKKKKQQINIDVDDKNKIYEIVANYMASLPDGDIIEDEITIEITDNNIPTFEFYDLPGIRTYPTNLAEMTINLCKKYLEDKNVIVLCVVPTTTTRLSSCQSIALIKEMDMEENCILALTMTDRLTSDLDELLISRITQKSDEVKDLNFAGYVAVVNRTHTDEFNLEESEKHEVKWFTENIVNNIPDDYLNRDKITSNITISNLVCKIDLLYSKFIYENWKPKMIKRFTQKIKSLEKVYESYGTENVNAKEMNELITNFIKKELIIPLNLARRSINELSDYYKCTEKNTIESDSESDEDTDEDDDNQNYGNMMEICMLRIISEIIKYRGFTDDYLVEKIECFFENDNKLKRFEYVLEMVIEQVHKFYTLNDTFQSTINEYMKNAIYDGFVKDPNMNKYYSIYKNIIKNKFYFDVLYPLLTKHIVINFKSEDYYESPSYKKQRETTLNEINEIKNHLSVVNELEI